MGWDFCLERSRVGHGMSKAFGVYGQSCGVLECVGCLEIAFELLQALSFAVSSF